MKNRPVQLLVLSVAATVAVAGAGIVRLSARKSQAELHATAERMAVASSDALETKLTEITAAVDEIASNLSQSAAIDFKELAERSKLPISNDLALFLVSGGRVIASLPEGSSDNQFLGVPFEDLADAEGTTGGFRRRQTVTSGPLRLSRGGWAILLEEPISVQDPRMAGRSTAWVTAAVNLDHLSSSAGLSRLPGQGLDYDFSYHRTTPRSKLSLLSSSLEPLTKPVERTVSFLGDSWVIAISPHGGWFPWSSFFPHISLVFVIVLAVSILMHDLAKVPEDLRQEIKKRDLRLEAANNKLTQESQQRSDLEKQFSHASYHDSLTGLPNRIYFMNRIERALRRAHLQPESQIAVLIMNFDRFKNVNDSLGHAAGDTVLVEAARRFENCLRPSDLLLAKLGNDELAFLLFEIENVDTATSVAQRLQDALATPFQVGKQSVFLTGSIGIALSSPESATPDDLIRGAGIALSMAKTTGMGHYEVFEPSARDKVLLRQELESDLRRAIEQKEFGLYFQPIVSLLTGEIAGMEVLIRWHHPVEGLLTPIRFIPLAEDTGLIVPLNRAIIRAACEQTRIWRQTLPGGMNFYLSVNLNAVDLHQNELTDFFAGLLSEYQIPPGMLRAEVTESGMISDVKVAVDVSSRLRALGVPLLLDDFGTGYSSLSYLQLFKFDYLKIDMSFVRRVTDAGENMELIRAIVNMAESLGLKTIAEGVENASVMKHLQHAGCNFGQGYYFSKPVEAQAIEELLRSQRIIPLVLDPESSRVLQTN